MKLVDGPHDHGLYASGHHFDYPELLALENDAVLSRVHGYCFLRNDLKLTAARRAIALFLAIPAQLQAKLLLGRLSAAWVYTGSHQPPEITALIDGRRRSGSLPPFSALQVHEVHLGRFDISALGPVRLTTPLRTAVDLCFMTRCPTGWPSPEDALRSLLSTRGLGCRTAAIREAISSWSGTL